LPKNRRRHYRITASDAISAHHRAITQFGGHDGVLEFGRIEAAVARPYSGYYRPIYRKAAALIHALVTNHGFVDGNKRTAYYLVFLLLEKSGFSFAESTSTNDRDDIEHLILDLTTHFLDFEETVNWLKRRIHAV
jgi:death-on-curing protein